MISEIKAASLFSSTILTEYYSGEDPRHRPCSDRERDHSSPVEKVPPHFFVICKKREVTPALHLLFSGLSIFRH